MQYKMNLFILGSIALFSNKIALKVCGPAVGLCHTGWKLLVQYYQRPNIMYMH